MRYLPHSLAALAVVAIAGAVSGEAIGDSPVLKADVQETLPDAQPMSATQLPSPSSKRPPDQYPLETPDGVIEVGELAMHGRLRDTPHAHWWRNANRDLGAQYEAQYDEADLARLAHEEALIAYTAQPPAPAPAMEQVQAPQRVTRAEAPMALAEPAAPEPPAPAARASIGNAKSIDVAAALEGQGS